MCVCVLVSQGALLLIQRGQHLSEVLQLLVDVLAPRRRRGTGKPSNGIPKGE